MNRWCLGALAGMLAAAPALAQSAAPPTSAAVNELIAAKWKEAGIKQPAKRATDLEFLRRAFIDIIGRTPSTEEVLDFEQDQAGNKRVRLIKRLLYAEKYVPKPNGAAVMLEKDNKKEPLSFNYKSEYAEHWANVWTVWLMTRSGHPQYRESMRFWLQELVFEPNMSYKEFVSQLLTATGKTNGNPAVNFIVHHLGDAVPRERQMELGKHDAVPITSRVTRLFLGLQTQCTQCHDHPFNKEWVQSDYWGVNAFFRQTVRDQNPTPGGNANGQMMANAVQVSLTDDDSYNGDNKIFYERRDGKLMAAKPNFLKDYAEAEKGESPNKTISAASSAGLSGKSRRAVLAHYVTKHDNFGRAYVNRMWGHFFGRGLNKEASVDDFGSNNEVVHPELLDRLADDFRKYEYDPKQLIEWICCSDAYSLSHEATPAYADAKFDPYFARMPLKSMSPEVLYESVMSATKAERSGKAEERVAARNRFLTQLVRNFGDDEGNEMTFNGTVIQALILMNGEELNGEVSKRETNAVNQLVLKYTEKGKAPPPSKVLDELFLMTVNRHATSAEISTLLDFMNGKRKVTIEVTKPEKPGAAPKKPAAPGAKPDPKDAGTAKVTGKLSGTNAADIGFYQDVFWALLNTNEFILNH